MTEPRVFDLAGELPDGTTLLEASAGTGKTYAIAGLVARWVAERPVRLPELLVVTFTRAATAELRDRVRRRLVVAADAIEAAMTGTAPDPGDDVLTRLCDGAPDELELRRRRLVRALSDVDVATISTIHGFCQHVLDGLGIASELDRDAELVNDLTDLIEEVVDDLYVGTYLEPGDRPRVSRHELASLARAVVGNPTTALVPTGPSDPTAGLRLHLAQRLREEVRLRARRRRKLSFDDLLTQLDDVLQDPERGGAARAALRQRYKVTLIDEFQDTDPVQWSIVSRAFGEPAEGRALVLIGDPKQAIYAFRGADVYAYLDAAGSAAERRTLGTNWRSDATLLRAFDAVFGGASFGDEDIPYRPVEPAPGHDRPRFLDAPTATPVRLRRVPSYDHLLNTRGKLGANEARELIAQDVAADVVRVLGAGCQLVGREADGSEARPRPLVPRDIAVLVRANYEAAMIQSALDAVGVPAVVGGVDSVFATEAATEWRRLLEALERPASVGTTRALALTSWVGWNGDDVVAASERDWDQLHEDVHRWAETLRGRGVVAMHRSVMLEREVRPRLLTRAGGERLLADLEHIGELLHAAAASEHLGATGLLGWLQDRVDEAEAEQQDERLRRLETDDEAVQILTIHRSKGLEFPVVYCPYLWSSNTQTGAVPVFHDPRGRRQLDVGGRTHPDFSHNCDAAEAEARGEELRLVYVAMTRARHQVVAWYAPAGQPKWSGLGRLLLCRDGAGEVDTDQPVPDLSDDDLVTALEAVASASDGHVAVETVPAAPATTPWAPPRDEPPRLDRARFARDIDESWRRTSYSGLTRLDDPVVTVGSEPAEDVIDDEHLGGAALPAEAVGRDERLRALEVPLADMPGGTHVGTFVHRLLEHTDFAADDLEAELTERIGRLRAGSPSGIDPELVTSGLATALRTALGPAVGDLSLVEVSRSDRRDEVEFELPLDLASAGRPATVGDIASLLREHLPADDPLAGYPDHIEPVLLGRDLRGFLGGSIDLVLRRAGDDGPVFHVADYKTNRLGTWGEPLTAWDYRPAALAEAMMHGHYPIQALLYAVALHRILRWRQADYDPARHLGGPVYLFLRGMLGPDAPRPGGRPCGVFVWDLPPALVTATSDRLHGRVAA